MNDGSWTCPDCAEQVATDTSACPYCGYGAVAAAAARWGYCPVCGRSEWEGAVGRCAACGAFFATAPPPTGGEVPSQTATSEDTAPAQEESNDRQPVSSEPAEADIAVEAPASAGQPPVVAQRLAAESDDTPLETEVLLPASDPAAATAVTGPTPALHPDGIALLRELAGLRDEGIITAEEFDTKKAEILRRL